MILAGVLLKLGGYGFLRFSWFVSCSFSFLGGYIFRLGLLGSFFSCFLCLRQVDLKSFVAYSSVCHMGSALAGIFCLVSFGYWGGIFMMVGHGFCSSCLFYILYVFYERFHSRRMLILKGCLFFFPVLGMWWFLFRVLNIGVPPSLPFFSEVFICVGLGRYNFFSYVFCGLVLFLSGLYRIYIYVGSMHGLRFFRDLSIFVSIREYLIFYAHFYPSVFFPLWMTLFFW